MTTPDFTLDLGNGIHVDSAGRLVGVVPDGVASFTPSMPLPIPKAAVQDVFGAVGAVLPQMEKVGGLLGVKDSDFFEALGLSQELIDTFGKIGDIASTLAAAIPYVNLAVGLIKAFSAFGGADPLASLVAAEFDRLHERLDEDKRLEMQAYIAEFWSVFDAALNEVSAYRNVIAKEKKFQAPGEAEAKRNSAATRVTNVYEKLSEALMRPWVLPFSTNDFFNHWRFNQDVFHTVPNSGTATPAHYPGSATPFDHRPMVQVLGYGIQVYLTLIKAVIPEHRTTGQYHTALRSAADKLSNKIEQMRAETLARTIHKPGVPFFKVLPRQLYVLTVGAMDLRADTDWNLNLRLNPADHPGWYRYGNLYAQWRLEPGNQNCGNQVEVDGDDWWTINPAAVEAANRQAERDYAAVLARSGYFTLAHLEALMRHLSTEPDRSETVTASAHTVRTPLTASPVKVKNDRIPFSQPVQADASREPQQCKAYVTVTTQGVTRDSAVGYRVRLLTLPDGTTETPFDWYVWTDYAPDGPRNRQLKVHVNDGVPLDPVGDNQRLLIEGISSSERKTVSRTVTLTADTFDWYVAVPDSPIGFELSKDLSRFAGISWTGSAGDGAKPKLSPPPGPGGNGAGTPVGKRPSVLTDLELTAAGTYRLFADDEPPKGQKREWSRTQIEIKVELDWHEEKLNIKLTPRPQDRNYVVYVVVEELLTRSQQFLRTPVQIRFNGQVTYVPQSFFDAEERAKNRAKDILDRIEENYSKSREPGPLDPVIAGMRAALLDTVDGMQEFVGTVRRHAPDVLEKALAELDAVTSTQRLDSAL